ncbi:MAG: hypothetical protein JWO70_464, partial [Betaproteobacteria bacterium]|nr:hypothetical protein [Betaproteobacteria bacterium]
FIGRSETDDAYGLTFHADQPDLGGIDFAVDPGFLFLSYATVLLWLMTLTPSVLFEPLRLSDGK